VDRLGEAGDEALLDRIEADFRRGRDALLSLTGEAHLLEHTPVIRKSIDLRNPYTDVLNLLQVELLARARREGDSPAGSRGIRDALLSSVNGLAAAMQSTG
jgi:phosphoenolpyruvate carboxylase